MTLLRSINLLETIDDGAILLDGRDITDVKADPDEARKHLAKNTFTPDNVVDMVSMLGYVMAGDLSPKQLADFQAFADFGTSIGVVPEKVDVTKFIQKF